MPQLQAVLQIPTIKWDEYTKALSMLSQTESDRLFKRHSARSSAQKGEGFIRKDFTVTIKRLYLSLSYLYRNHSI